MPAMPSEPPPEQILRERPHCELCGHERPEELLARPYDEPPLSDHLRVYYEGRVPADLLAGHTYQLLRCRGCSFAWQAWVPTPAAAELLYESWISPHGSLLRKSEAEVSLFAGYARQVELMARLAGRRPHRIAVLDFGMGWGYWCLMAQAHGYRVTGVETAADRLEFARDHGIEAVAVLDELGDRRFDYINAEQVFEHVTEPLELLSALVDRLAPGGWVRLSVPNCAPPLRRVQRGRWRPEDHPLQPLEHINCFTNRTLRELAARAGLSLARQPWLPGQGLLGKSFRRGPRALLLSVAGVPYRRFLGTTLWFRRTAEPAGGSEAAR